MATGMRARHGRDRRPGPGDRYARHVRRRLLAYRGDGPVARGVEAFTPVVAEPLPAALIALVVTAVLLTVFGHAWVALPAAVVAVAANGGASGSRHTGRCDWLVPPLIGATEYLFLAIVGLRWGAPHGLVYVLLAVVTFHHYDTVYRTRQGVSPQPSWQRAGLGWDGRLIVAAVCAAAGVTTVGYAVLAAYLAVLFVAESATGWLRTTDAR